MQSIQMNYRYLVVFMIVGIRLATHANADESVSVRVEKDLEFARVEGQSLKLDLYVPVTYGKPALVVWIHGGGWRGGSRKNPRIAGITQHGYALASISYRFTDKAIFPAQIHDCKAAIRWLRAHANQYGYDARWIAVAGSSAGGHLALLMGVSGNVKALEGQVGDHPDQSSVVQAVVDYFGPSDFVLRGRTQPQRAYTEKSGSFALLGGVRTGKLTQDMETFASPAHYVSAGDPPLLVFHGKADEVVLLDQSQRIVTLYEIAGLEARLVTLENAGHGAKQLFTGQHFETMKAFLDRNRPQ
jgi:acetyl esterase/lipase